MTHNVHTHIRCIYKTYFYQFDLEPCTSQVIGEVTSDNTVRFFKGGSWIGLLLLPGKSAGTPIKRY